MGGSLDHGRRIICGLSPIDVGLSPTLFHAVVVANFVEMFRYARVTMTCVMMGSGMFRYANTGNAMT